MADAASTASTGAQLAGLAASAFGSPVLGGIVSGLGSLIGGSNSNSSARKLQQQQLDWNAQMAATAHQREVADLKAAGLNPILSAGGAGSTPAGVPPPPVVNSLENATQSAMSGKRLNLDAEVMKANIAKVKSDTALNDVLADTQKTAQQLNLSSAAAARANAALTGVNTTLAGANVPLATAKSTAGTSILQKAGALADRQAPPSNVLDPRPLGSFLLRQFGFGSSSASGVRSNNK